MSWWPKSRQAVPVLPVANDLVEQQVMEEMNIIRAELLAANDVNNAHVANINALNLSLSLLENHYVKVVAALRLALTGAVIYNGKPITLSAEILAACKSSDDVTVGTKENDDGSMTILLADGEIDDYDPTFDEINFEEEFEDDEFEFEDEI